MTGANMSDPEAARRMLDASPIVPDAILSAADMFSAPPMDTMIQLRSVGPLVGAITTHKFFSSMVPTPLPASDFNGMVMVPNATFGRYLIPAGALDAFLTTNLSTPVVTIAPLLAVLGIPYSNHTVVISPAAGMVYAMYEARTTGLEPSNLYYFNNVPDIWSFRAVYDAINDGPLPEGDYLARDYPSCSPASLAVAASDVLLSGTTGLIGLFISKAYNQSHNDTPSSMVSCRFAISTCMNALCIAAAAT
jgi:hypothetical protein